MFVVCLAFILASQHVLGADLIAYFDQNDFRGSIKFTQLQENDDVTIVVDLKIPVGVANISWKIYSLPSLYYPAAPQCQNLGNEIRDLSSDHGFLITKSTYQDSKLKIIGKDSVLGRSVVFFSEDSSGNLTVSVACAVILPSNGTSYAKVGISNDLISGSIEFLQYDNYETVIYGYLSRSDGLTDIIDNVELYVYKSNIPLNCNALSEIYNPLNVNGTCSTMQESSCKIGDLKSKFGTISIDSNSFFMLDKSLPLIGNESIVGQSLVIKMSSSNSRCGVIKKYGPLQVQSRFTPSENQGIDGFVSFQQDSPYNPTKLLVELKGLNNRTNGYHVHLFPISIISNPCSPDSVSGHLNPFDVVIANSPAPNNGSVDKYEIGDLSGKFGGLKGASAYNLSTYDLNLPLYGLNTVIGRSVVIHNDDNVGSRLTCSDIKPVKALKYASGFVNYTAKEGAKYSGYVHLRQYLQSNDVYTPTIIVVDVNPNDKNDKTIDHNFHVHVQPVGNDSGVCMSAGPHYNPTKVNVANTAVYNEQCNAKHPHRCEVGDTSKKVGTYNMGGGKAFFADFTTPLFGDHTVLGRSVVFHEANKGPARIACGDIVPMLHDTDTSYLEFDLNDKSLQTKTDTLKDSLAKALELVDEPWKITYLKTMPSNMSKNCFRVTAFILDKSSSRSYQDIISQILKDEPSKFPHYKQCVISSPSASITKKSSSILAVISVIVYVWTTRW